MLDWFTLLGHKIGQLESMNVGAVLSKRSSSFPVVCSGLKPLPACRMSSSKQGKNQQQQ